MVLDLNKLLKQNEPNKVQYKNKLYTLNVSIKSALLFEDYLKKTGSNFDHTKPKDILYLASILIVEEDFIKELEQAPTFEAANIVGNLLGVWLNENNPTNKPVKPNEKK